MTWVFSYLCHCFSELKHDENYIIHSGFAFVQTIIYLASRIILLKSRNKIPLKLYKYTGLAFGNLGKSWVKIIIGNINLRNYFWHNVAIQVRCES